MKEELSCEAKLSIYWTVYVPTLTYGHEIWLVTGRTWPWIQAAEIRWVVGLLNLRDLLRSSDVWRELRVEPLVIGVEGSRSGCLLLEVFQACPAG